MTVTFVKLAEKNSKGNKTQFLKFLGANTNLGKNMII